MKIFLLLLILITTVVPPTVAPPTVPPRVVPPNFGKITENIYRGAQPIDFKELELIGIRTVLNLRNDEHYSKELAKDAGLVYKNIPMSSRQTPKISNIQQALDIIQNPKNQPVYVFCESGKHRTGVVIAVWRVIEEGWDKKKAWAEAYEYGFYRGFGHGVIEDWFLKKFNPKDFR